MKHTYKISGMTCNGCRTHVEEALTAVPGVALASVDLEKESAIIEMNTPISLEKLQEVLSAKYTISPIITVSQNVFESSGNPSKESSELQQLFPLFLILGYITIAAILLNRTSGGISGFMLDFMGLFYIVFSFFKILGLKGFPDSFRMYDPLAKVFPAYGWAYPFIETLLGILFLMRIQIGVALIATILILGITTIGVAKTLLDKKAIQCACLGTVLKLPMTKATLIENAIMLVMAVWMLTNSI